MSKKPTKPAKAKKKLTKPKPRRRVRRKPVNLRDISREDVVVELCISHPYTHDCLRDKNGKPMLFDLCNYSGVTIKAKDLPQLCREIVRVYGKLSKRTAEVELMDAFGLDHEEIPPMGA